MSRESFGPEADIPIGTSMAEFVDHLRTEFRASIEPHGMFNSCHEGKAVIEEELEALWDEVKKKRHLRDRKAMYAECVQIASTAMKFAISFGETP